MQTASLWLQTVFIAGALASPAAALSVSETTLPGSDTLGDFARLISSATDIGTLDLGVNTIFGSIACDRNDLIPVPTCASGNNSDASDWFRFTVAENTEITKIELTVSDFSQPSGGPGAFTGMRALPSLTSLGGNAILGDFTASVFTTPGPGDYAIQVGTSDGGSQTETTLSYSFSIDVVATSTQPPNPPAPVPLPAGLPLLMSAFGAAVLLRNRRRDFR